jgi:LPXTG-motif cell wall-anchored protein
MIDRVGVRRSGAAVLLAGGLALGSAAAASASVYPPSAPAPTSGSSTDTAVRGTKVGAGGETLPRTGSQTLVWTVAGTALLGGGTALVLVSRRRQSD